MNKARLALLETVFGEKAHTVRRMLYVTARAHRVSVDDLVQAGLGRGSSSEAARGAQEVKQVAGPTIFAVLQDVWPFVCPFCQKDVPRPEEAGVSLGKCPECPNMVCSACITRYGCPPCDAKARERIKRGKEATAESEQNRKWLARQVAAPPPPAVDLRDEDVPPADWTPPRGPQEVEPIPPGTKQIPEGDVEVVPKDVAEDAGLAVE